MTPAVSDGTPGTPGAGTSGSGGSAPGTPDRPLRTAPVIFDVRREFLRSWRLGLVATIAVYLAGVAIGAAAGGFPVGLAYLGLVPISPVAAVVTWWLFGRRLFPGSDAVRWVERETEGELATVLGDPPVTSAEEAVDRLAGRTDAASIEWRARLLAQTGPADELRVALTEWQPGDPVGQARRVRVESQLTLMEGRDDGLRAAWDAATALADPADRAAEQARVLVDEAGRAAATRRDPWPALVQAARALGPRLEESRTPADIAAREALRRSFALRSLVPSVVILVLLVLILGT